MGSEVTIASLGGDYPFLYSNIVSILGSAAIAILGSMSDPDNDFRWPHLSARLPLVDDMPPPIEDGRTAAELDEFLIQSYKRSCWVANGLFFFLCLLLPVSLYASGAIFGSGGFGIWIIFYLLWCFIGGLTVIILPILDFKKDLAKNQEMARRVTQRLSQVDPLKDISKEGAHKASVPHSKVSPLEVEYYR